MNNRNARVMPWAVMFVLAFGGAAMAQSTASSDAPPVEAAVDQADEKPKSGAAPVEEERLICRREKTIGSNRSQRVCRTAAEIRAQREAAQESVRSGDVPSQ